MSQCTVQSVLCRAHGWWGETRVDPYTVDRYAELMSLARRTVRFTLSTALAAGQEWAVGAFPTVIQRATGYSERWTLVAQSVDAADGAPAWQYEVLGLPEIDLVVDHIIHELTDAVILSEWHTVTEDRFTFGSMRRDKPEPTRSQPSREEHPA